MKVALYLLMLLLLDPIVRVGGVVVAALFLMVMFALGVYLLVRRTDRPRMGPQQPPPVVYVVAPQPWPAPVPRPVPPRHPAHLGLHDDEAPPWVWDR